MRWTGPEILGVAEHASLDNLAVASGISIESLMENAGRQVANEIAKRWPAGRVFVVCGPGNNGGDGYVAARHLAARGYEVTVKTIGDHRNLPSAAAVMARQWTGPTEPWVNRGSVRMGVYVDAAFGAGLNRAVTEDFAEYWYLVRESGSPIVAIDVPSGLHGDKAAFLDQNDWSADLTVTFFRKKPAHVLMPGRKICGEIAVTDIGMPPGLIHALAEVAQEGALPSLLFAAENGPPAFDVEPEADAHKYWRGHCVVVMGPALATGAARLTARAALRTGAGLVTLAGAPDAALVCAQHVTAEMVRAYQGTTELSALLADPRVRAIAIGPGLGRDVAARDAVLAVLASGKTAVLDADALSAFENDPQPLFDAIRNQPDRPVTLTPHDGEFERVFPGLRKRAVNKIEAAKMAADKSGAFVILKGADTVIADPGGQVRVNANAPPWLATAGSGDVLAGIVVGFLAQGHQPFSSVCAAVWLHGAAGALGGPGLIASDLPNLVPELLKNLSGPPKFAL